MDKENIKLLIKQEYENGTSMSVLAKKYDINISNIKKWSYQEKWIKKKQNKVTKKGIAKTKKSNQNKIVTLDKDTQIKKDIINSKDKKEIMSEYGISERTYQRKVQSIRKVRLERTERYLDEISKKVYPDLENVLENAEKAKRNLIVRAIKEIGSESTNIKKVEEYKKAFDYIKQMSNDVARTNKILSTYEILEIEKQLAEEETQRNRLEIEKAKQGTEEDKKVEIKIIGVD